MDIGVACLIGCLVDVIAAFQCVGTEEVPQRVRGNGIGVCIKDPIDLPPGQVFTVPPGKEVRAVGGRPFLQVLPNCILLFLFILLHHPFPQFIEQNFPILLDFRSGKAQERSNLTILELERIVQ